MNKATSAALTPEQDLPAIATAQGGLSRLAMARLKSAGVPVAPLLQRVGLTPELIADPELRLLSSNILASWLSRMRAGGLIRRRAPRY